MHASVPRVGFAELLHRLRNPEARLGRILLVAAGVLFGVLAVIGSQEIARQDLPWSRWALLGGLEACVVLAVVVLNAVELQAIGGSIGQSVTFRFALRISLLASAANNLPLPGGTFLRIAAVTSPGSKLSRATRATIAAGLCWLSVGSVAASIAMAGIASHWSLAAALVAAASLSGCWLLMPSRKRLLRLVAIESGLTAVLSVRYWLVFWALGITVPASSGVVLALAVPVSSVVGVFPGGLGLREVLGAGLGSIIGMSFSTVMGAMVVDRVLVTALMALIALFVARSHSDSRVPGERLEE